MFTGTDETRGLEEWNVNTIAHLEPEKPESFSALWDGGGVGVHELAVSWQQALTRLPLPDFKILCCYTVIITNSTNKTDLLAKNQARFSLASEGGIPPYYQEVRWAVTLSQVKQL